MALWDEVKENLVDWYGKAAEATEGLARLGVRKYDRFGVSRDIEHQFTELGSQVYKLLVEEESGDVEADARVQQILARVQELEAELRSKDAEIEELRQRRRSQGGPAGPGSGPQAHDDPEAGQGDSGENPTGSAPGSGQESTTGKTPNEGPTAESTR